MLLSPTDKARFIICYPDYSHEELAKLFGVTKKDIRDTAKRLGIYSDKYRKNDILPSAAEKLKYNI